MWNNDYKTQIKTTQVKYLFKCLVQKEPNVNLSRESVRVELSGVVSNEGKGACDWSASPSIAGLRFFLFTPFFKEAQREVEGQK